MWFCTPLQRFEHRTHNALICMALHQDHAVVPTAMTMHGMATVCALGLEHMHTQAAATCTVQLTPTRGHL